MLGKRIRWCRKESTWLRRRVARTLGVPRLGDRLRVLERPDKHPWFFVTTASHYFHILSNRQSCWRTMPVSESWKWQLANILRRNPHVR